MKSFVRPHILAGVLLCVPAMSVSAFQASAGAKGSVAGRVVNAVSGDAVRKVNLTLTPMSASGKPVTAQSDENGAFAFKDIEPGGYRLSGEKTGFARQGYGARLNPNLGAVLGVKDGEALQLIFQLAPNAVISGRVVDQEGEPMPNLVVAAMRMSYVRGKRQWSNAGGAQTNDRGEYRIGELRAGRYLVSATDMNIGIGMVAVTKGDLPAKPESSYSTTYFGNLTDIARATPIDLRVGEDRRGTDIQMMKVPTVRVRGKATGVPDGKYAMMMLVRKGSGRVSSTPVSLGMAQPTDGSFEIKGVLPGSYLLVAGSAMDAMAPLGPAAPIEVGEQHLDGVEYRVAPGADLPGSVSLAGEAADLKGVTIALDREDFPLPNAPSAHPGEDGAFTLKNVFAGKYILRITDRPEKAFVKSVKLAGQEVDESALELTGGAAGKLEIVLSAAGAEVEGTVVGPDDKPLAGGTVTLMPDSRRETLYARTAAGPDGAFHLKGVRPGKYKILAWEDVEAGAPQDAEFIEPFLAQAQALTLDENGRVKVTLKAIPFDKVAAQGVR